MPGYDYVDRRWIVSPTARTVYRVASVVSLFFYPCWITVRSHGFLHPIVKPLLLLTIVAMVLNSLAMECFLFRFDQSNGLKQVFWFCVMIFIPLGPALYCFIVYSRSEAFRAASTQVDRCGSGPWETQQRN